MVVAKRFDDALADLAAILEAEPENPDALFLSGSLARAAGDTQEAKMYWNKLLPLLPAEETTTPPILRMLAAASCTVCEFDT